MRYPGHDPQLQLMPVQSDSSNNPGRRWFNQIVMQSSLQGKPGWVHLPDRVWRRNSALLMSMHERKQFDD
ncbi:MAG: hypothetical protein PVJ68_05590 [Candidatus Thiodiazotropha sp.]|jgi:hypothetical protein